MPDFLRLKCPACGKGLKAPPAFAGKQVRCTGPECRTVFRVGAAEPLPPPLARRATSAEVDAARHGAPVVMARVVGRPASGG